MADLNFTFGSSGADRLGRDMRGVSDTSALAARGARLLSDALEKQRKAADVSAGASLALAKADDILTEAEHGLRDGALEAEFALKKQAEAAKKPLVPQVLTGKALKSLGMVQLKAEELRAKFPQFTVQINDKAAKLELALFAAEAKGTLDKIDKGLGGAGGRGGIGGIAGKLFGGGAGAAAGAGPAASSGTPLLGAIGGPGAIAASVAGLLALPFAAQAAGGGIVAAFGAATAGMAIVGATRAKSVQDSFARLKIHASADLTKIGTSFVPVMNSILGTAGKVLAQMTPIFANAAKTISGPFKTFGDALLRAFGQPAVKQSIQAVAGSFGAILKAVTPGLAGNIGGIAGGISSIARAVAANPQAIAAFVTGLFKIGQGALNAIGALIRTANYVEQHFGPAMHRTAVIFDGVRHDIAHIWDQIFSNSVGSVIRIGHNVGTQFNSMRHGIAVVFGGARHDISAAWDTIWNNTTGRVIRGIGDVVRFVHAMPGRIVTTLGAAGTVLSGWGSGVIHGLLSGMTNIIGSVWTFIKGIPGKILHFLGIKSPPQWAIDAGKHIMNGIGIGMGQAQGKLVKDTAQFSAASLAGAVGGGTAGPGGGAPAANAALARRMMPAWGSGAEWNAWNTLMMHESGWNQFARNPSSGAYGIPQALPPGKMGAAANPPRSNPAAQISWMIGYIKSAYGDPIRAWAQYYAHPGGVGYYAKGTAGAAPGWGWVGERGPELVNFRGGEQVLPATRLGGYATGTAGAGAAYLKAWQTRHGGPYALAVGPKVLNEQIPEMAAALGRAKTLAGAPGLSAGQHRFWAGAAAGETRLLATLLKERTTERAWRTMLGVNELGLDKEIRAAGSLPSLAKNVRGWKAQMGRDKATVTAISKMLGYSDAYIKAHPAAKPGPVLPGVTHSYGGDVTGTIGAVLAAALGPFTGGVVADRGATLRPGWNPPLFNGTNRPEQLVPAGGGKLEVTLKLDSSFTAATGLTPQQVANIRATVRRVGGTGPGAVDRAFGNR